MKLRLTMDPPWHNEQIGADKRKESNINCNNKKFY